MDILRTSAFLGLMVLAGLSVGACSRSEISGTSTPSMGTTNCYLVKAGDSLQQIASRYGLTVSSLKQVNGLESGTVFAGQYLVLSGVPSVNPWSVQTIADRNMPLADILKANEIAGQIPDPLIVVDKSDHTLSVFSDGDFLKSYYVALGDGGSGDKQVSGDHRTPEGRFYINECLVLDPPDQVLGSRWFQLSYPTVEDAGRGLARGLIVEESYQEIVQAVATLSIPPQGTALGGGIGIHGGSAPGLGDYWTWGCVGLTNADIEEIYPFIGLGTPVVITP